MQNNPSNLLNTSALTGLGSETGCNPDGASAITWKWEVAGGPIMEGRPSKSTW